MNTRFPLRPLMAGLAATALVAAVQPARAQALADLAAIDRAVADFTGAPLGTAGGAAYPVDRRLRLNPCTVPLSLNWYGARQDSVEVTCPMTGGWKLYVPLVAAPRAASAAAAPPAVTRGDAVTITVNGDGFAVSQSGEALESGPVGAWIKVRGLSDKAPVIRARVIRPGLVGVDLGNAVP